MKYSISINNEKGFVSVRIASPENTPGHLSVPQDTKIHKMTPCDAFICMFYQILGKTMFLT